MKLEGGIRVGTIYQTLIGGTITGDNPIGGKL
jgi:hypothetical protein